MNKIEGIYMLCHFLGLAISLNANIGEFDEYWQKSKFEAVKYFEDAYHPDSYNVTHHFNQQVHLSMQSNKPYRRLLEMPTELGGESKETSRLLHWVRQGHDRRKSRKILRGNRLIRQRFFFLGR
ncbi:unnamed protein product [Amaranthus hypochondriacus]